MSRILKNALTGVISITMGIIFIYGRMKFPDAPINLGIDNIYKGKQGQIRTKEEYEKYNQWILTMQLLWPSGIVAIFLLQKRK